MTAFQKINIDNVRVRCAGLYSTGIWLEPNRSFKINFFSGCSSFGKTEFVDLKVVLNVYVDKKSVL